MKQYHTKLMKAFHKEFAGFDYAESDFVDTPFFNESDTFFKFNYVTDRNV